MRQGATISGGMHLILMLLVLFSGTLFRLRDPQPVVVAEVSLISAEAFDAARSAAPAEPVAEVTPPDEPAEAANDAATPAEEPPPEPAEPPEAEPAPESEAAPDVSGLAAAEPDVALLPDVAGPEEAPDGASLVTPLAEGHDAPSEALTPGELPEAEALANDAPRIDTESAPEPPEDAVPAEEVVEEVTPVPAEEVVEEPPEEPAAPEEATTEVVPEPAEIEVSALAPLVTAPPRGRPGGLGERVAAPELEVAAEAEAEAAAQAEAEAAAIEAAMAELAAEEPAEEAETSQPASGPPMTAGEKDGLRLAVQKCWNVPAGLRDAGNLVVVVGVELAQDGSLAGAPFLIEPAGDPGEGFRQAFEAGRRALIRCAPYDLPPEKYDQWRQLEVVFNPEKMVVR